jgi:hypothetical protein
MADERDSKVSQRYREMGAEEPPRALDEAILGASRRAVARRRWYGPVALAASLVLVVAVTIQVEREKPAEEVVASAPPQPSKEAPAPVEAPKPQEKKQFSDHADRLGELAKQQPPEPARREMEAQRPQASAAAGARMMAKVESPEAWLERIVELRKQGKHEQADKALADFRQRYPDYRLSDEMKAKVERK